jgi:hypothetical protein
MTYMFRLMRTLVKIRLRNIGQLLIPYEVLSTVQAAPVPVSPHDSANEGRVVVVRSRVVLKRPRLDVVGGRRDCRGGREGDEGGEDFHFGGVGCGFGRVGW